MNSEYDVRISSERAKAFAIAVGGSIAEYVKTHQVEYELFLLEEKEDDYKSATKHESIHYIKLG